MKFKSRTQQIIGMKKYIFLVVILLGVSLSLSAQQTLDKIIGIVGEEIILDSDVDNQYNYLVINGQKDDGGLRCQVIDNIIISKLLLNKAIQDSIEVTEPEVDGEVERRVQSIMSQLPSPSEFEKIYGKSIYEFKVDIREDIRKEMLIDRQRQALMSQSDITPREVKSFFEKIPSDSLGLLPAEVELNHIMIIPPFSVKSKEEAKGKLEEIRKQIVEENADFGELARQHSEGPSSRDGGSLGEVRRGVMVPEFEEVIYNLREGEVSGVFETQFGYHIAKLFARKGEILTVSHILMIPDRSVNGDSVAIDHLKKAKEFIDTDSLTFEQAAIKFSEDRVTKDCGGCISNPQTGELRIPLDLLDAELFFKVDDMEEGEISEPMEHFMADGTRAFHILYLKNKIPPHQPNLTDDYNKIYSAALQMKQAESFEKWLESAKKNIYINLKPTECSNALQNWME